jgi:ceramide glucosyltransferase
MMAVLAGVTSMLTVVGLVQGLAAAWLVSSFIRRPREAPSNRPAVTVLKPLHGDEPLLEEALTSLCRQDYPTWQIVFGVQDAADPAVAVVRDLQARFPGVDIALVIDPAVHGANRKVGNLINMFPSARHGVLVIADSDVHVRPDYLDRLVATLQQQSIGQPQRIGQQPQVGLVTTLYAGLPVPVAPAVTQVGTATFWGRLGATQITHGFLPGAVLARALGRQDCLGATMCLRRDDLERIGGFRALAGHLADDNVLGRRIAALGLRVALADTVPLTTVPETTFAALFRHELRWARTIRALEPLGFAASVLQYPLAWALLTIGLACGTLWSIGLFSIVWVLRAVAALAVDSALAPLWAKGRGGPGRSNEYAALAFCCPVWLLPLRDLLSVTVMLVSYGGRQVDWRGHGLRADTPPPFTERSVTPRL